MRTNVGIVGYGNLGKSLEKLILCDKNYNLVAVFSRRNVKSKFNTHIESFENITLYKNKISIMFLCGGSKSDLEIQTPIVLKYFDCINTFDNHKKILTELKTLDKIAKQNNHILIMSCGWDPGIFSNIRALMFSISNQMPYTFWGKGVSMGHSDAIRQIKHVQDAVQLTIPNKSAISLAKQNKPVLDNEKHIRECYVVADKQYHTEISKKIRTIPNYFKNQKTIIHFVSQLQLLKLKSNLKHKGQIFSSFITKQGTKSRINFSVSMNSNPDFTTTIMLVFSKAITNLKQLKMFGAYTCLDVPMSFLFNQKNRFDIVKKLC